MGKKIKPLSFWLDYPTYSLDGKKGKKIMRWGWAII